MSSSARSFNSFGCQAMNLSQFMNIVPKKNPEDFFVPLTVLSSHYFGDLSWLDVVFEVNFELLEPNVEVFSR